MKRVLPVFLFIVCLVNGCGPGGDDFQQSRARFRTQLLKKEPSPQDYVFSFPPAGARLIYYASGDLRLKAWLAEDDPRLTEKNARNRKLPGVVFAHGGFSFGLSDWEDARPFSEAGFILLTPMLRGENGNPGYFEFFFGEVDDLIAAGDYLAGLPYLDADRLFLVGYSAGGTLALLCSMLKNPFKSIIAVGPSADQKIFFDNYWRTYVPFALDNILEVKLRSPIEYVPSIKTPLFILVGDMDLALKEQSLQFARQAGTLHRPCEIEVVIGDHFSSLDKAILKSIEICRTHF